MSSYRILSSIGTKTDFCLLCALLRFVRFFLLSPFRRGANSSRVAYVLDCSETRFAIGQTHTHAATLDFHCSSATVAPAPMFSG